MYYQNFEEFLNYVFIGKDEVLIKKEDQFSFYHGGKSMGNLPSIYEEFENNLEIEKSRSHWQRHRYKSNHILPLLISKKNFDVMITGEKTKEYRKYNDWISSRLIDNDTGEIKFWQYIRFSPTYYPTSPYFICEFLSFQICKQHLDPIIFSNNYVVDNIFPGDFILSLGEIVEKGNL